MISHDNNSMDYNKSQLLIKKVKKEYKFKTHTTSENFRVPSW